MDKKSFLVELTNPIIDISSAKCYNTPITKIKPKQKFMPTEENAKPSVETQKNTTEKLNDYLQKREGILSEGILKRQELSDEVLKPLVA